MTSTLPQEKPETTDGDSTWSNAPKLSRKVRELAHRSYHALKSGPQPVAQSPAASCDVLDDLRNLRDQVARLQRKIYARDLEPLMPWVDALKRQINDRLGDAGRTAETDDREPLRSSKPEA
jgi:hypothetical protein